MSPLWTKDGEIRKFHVYVMSNISMTLYTGVTSDLRERVLDHKLHRTPGFTSRYHCDRLVFFEEFEDIRFAIEREKEIKGWSRKKKIDLVQRMNPRWEDLSARIHDFRGADPSLPSVAQDDKPEDLSARIEHFGSADPSLPSVAQDDKSDK